MQVVFFYPHVERPKKKNHCAECRYDEVLDKLEAAAKSLGQKPYVVGDPGCLVTVADRIDAKYALGSAVSVADGLSKAGLDEKAVAQYDRDLSPGSYVKLGVSDTGPGIDPEIIDRIFDPYFTSKTVPLPGSLLTVMAPS